MKTVHSIVGVLVLLMVGCATAPKSHEGRMNLAADARSSLAEMERSDPSLSNKLAASYAYIVFPSAGKGGLIVGGAYGRGVVFRNGQVIGYADMTGAKIGLLAGGESFDQVVAFRDRGAYERLVNQGLSFTASASATVIKSGAAAKTQFREGVAVFVRPRGGLMGDLSLGGQKINFVSTSQYAKGQGRQY